MNTSNENSENSKLSTPVPLDPIIIRARDEMLERYSDKSLEEQITFYKAIHKINPIRVKFDNFSFG